MVPYGSQASSFPSHGPEISATGSVPASEGPRAEFQSSLPHSPPATPVPVKHHDDLVESISFLR